jgi:hypothetical protein
MEVGEKVKIVGYSDHEWTVYEIGENHVLLNGAGCTLAMDKDKFEAEREMKTIISSKELELLKASSMDHTTPYSYQDASKTHLSTARLAGGVTINGEAYIYIEYTDEIIREDVYRWLMARRKRKVEPIGKQGKLF